MQDDVAALEEAKLEWSGFRACVYITKHAAARGSGGMPPGKFGFLHAQRWNLMTIMVSSSSRTLAFTMASFCVDSTILSDKV